MSEEQVELITSAISGDRMSQEELFQEYWDLIENVVRSKGVSDSDVDDIVNTTLMMAFEELEDFHRRDDVPIVAAFEGWLKTIAGNRVIDAVRYQRAIKRGGGWNKLSSNSQMLSSAADVVAFLQEDDETASRIIARREAEACLADALQYLREISEEKNNFYYEAFRLRFIEGLTNEETAIELKCNEGQVRNWIRTARNILRERIGGLTQFHSFRGL
jgi:RNA polymerase sigma factor (sigma-70 family)